MGEVAEIFASERVEEPHVQHVVFPVFLLLFRRALVPDLVIVLPVVSRQPRQFVYDLLYELFRLAFPAFPCCDERDIDDIYAVSLRFYIFA